MKMNECICILFIRMKETEMNGEIQNQFSTEEPAIPAYRKYVNAFLLSSKASHTYESN